MAKIKNSLSTASPMDAEPAIMLHLDGKHAKKFAKHKIGQKVKMLVHGKKTSHNIYDTSKGQSHSVGFHIHKVEPYESKAEEAGETPEHEASEMKAGQ